MRKSQGLTGSEDGFSLIECAVSLFLVSIGLIAIMNLMTVSLLTSKGQGETATLATTLAKNKLEVLTALPFSDAFSDTTVSPTAASGGSGLCGEMSPGSSCGSVDPQAPATGFCDFLDMNGQPTGEAEAVAFIRQWKITAAASGDLKILTVRTSGLMPSASGPPPNTVLTTLIVRGG